MMSGRLVHDATRTARAELDVDGRSSTVELALGDRDAVVRWSDRAGVHHRQVPMASAAATLVAAVVDQRLPGVGDAADVGSDAEEAPPSDPADGAAIAAVLATANRVLRLRCHLPDRGSAVLSLARCGGGLLLVAEVVDAGLQARWVSTEEAVAVVLRELLRRS